MDAARRRVLFAACLAVGLIVGLAWAGEPAFGEVTMPEFSAADPIAVTAEAANRWQQGSNEVWLLRGNCRIRQGKAQAQSGEAVLWIDHGDVFRQRPSKVIAYLEGGVRIEWGEGGETPRLSDTCWLGSFRTLSDVQVFVAQQAGRPDVLPAIYHHAMEQRTPPASVSLCRSQETITKPADEVQPAQFSEPTPEPEIAPESVSTGTRRVRVFPRSDTVGGQALWYPDPNSDQWIALIDSGVNIIVDGLPNFGSIDVSADRVVIWTRGDAQPDLTGQTLQGQEIPLEIYMEGNIVFRQGERVIYADRMYYDVVHQVGTVFNAELLTPVPQYQGLLRLRAQILRQAGEGRYFAEETFFTSSRMGRPGYRIQSGDVYFEDLQSPLFEPFTGRPVVDPCTGQQAIDHQRFATASNNLIFLGEIPVFYWPVLATDLNDPTFYIRRFRIRNDRVYGTQFLTDWNAFELLGIRNRPEGVEWDVSLDWLGDRGLGHGTTVVYSRDQFLGVPGPAAGLFDYWGIQDRGFDNLGAGRRHVPLEKDYRWRLFWQHRQELADDLRLSAEVGWISDRNFLEEYFEREWDELKEQTTGVELKRFLGNSSWSITSDVRLNKFFTQTEWLPRGDHFLMGQSVFGDALTWYAHTQAGYGRFRPAAPPENPAVDPFTPLPWELNARQGERLITRHELDWPIQLGPVKIVPYALGELAHWGQDINGDDAQRAYVQSGVRASLPISLIDPLAESQLFNVHGLAHKAVFDIEFAYADSSLNLDQLPLYDPLDDDSIEAARHRFGPVAPQFDERYYAVRTGLASWVASPAAEIAEDLVTVRMGMRHRWQTKRGLPGCRRIVDWVVLDTNLTWYPDETRDNFGKAIGLLDYDFRWHIGDQTTLVSDGLFDFFDDGQQIVTVGGFLTRPPRGSLYLGLRMLEGPITSNVLSFSYSYWMSPKWVSSYGTSLDLSGDASVGHRFRITRIGESLLVSAGFTYNAARDNVGVHFSIEPRFLPGGRLGRVGGARIPVAGAYGLE